MIKYLLILYVTTTSLSSCGCQSNPINENKDNKTSISITTPGMSNPPKPIPEAQWKGDWNDQNHPKYRPSKYAYNPLQGYWILTSINGEPTKQFLAYRITYGRGIYLLTTKPAPATEPYFGQSRVQIYQINDTQIKVRDGHIYNYHIAADRSTMTLNDGTNTYTFSPYDNNGIWYWKGNWNSPSSPYYAIYHGKYNPVQGTWKKISYGDMKLVDDEYHKFYDDYTTGQSQISYGIFIKSANYEINQDGLIEDKSRLTAFSNTHKYWISGDTLFLVPYANGKLVPNKLTTLIRVN